ncbi:MAG: hypothetical protein ABJH72_18765 [Reichenbachiella sp.]|uniref:hypothetical protein n=1 Tax=Reichenbachiella sp. TaxID=2184521 RepID=UPI003265E517
MNLRSIKYITLLLLCLIIKAFKTFGHETNKASFEVVESDFSIMVKADFPWTIRNALFDASPELKEKSDKEEFENALFSYFSQNLQLYDVAGNELELLDYEPMPRSGHDHGAQYSLYYKKHGKPLAQIKNTCMFERNEDHENQHMVHSLAGTYSIFLTSKEADTYEIAEMEAHLLSNPEPYVYFLIFLIISGSLVYAVAWKRLNRLR